MTASTSWRAGSLCQRTTVSWPSRSRTTLRASSSSFEPGKVTTPHLIGPLGRTASAVGLLRPPRPRSGASMATPSSLLHLEAEILDHRVRKQLATHLTDPSLDLGARAAVDADLHVLADADVGDLFEPERV